MKQVHLLLCNLDHTLKRIVEIPNVKQRVMILDDKNVHSGILYCKLGFDGAASQSVYKNVWVNKKPSSAHFCRPVKLQY